MNLHKKWISHLKKNDMNYIEHLIFALFYGLCCLLAGLYLIIHSILPCFFPTAGSDLVTKLSKRFKKQH
jgi:hypothetical protein